MSINMVTNIVPFYSGVWADFLTYSPWSGLIQTLEYKVKEQGKHHRGAVTL
jgi:hypothetical protein